MRPVARSAARAGVPAASDLIVQALPASAVVAARDLAVRGDAGARPKGWLRSAAFDVGFVGGVLLVALAMGGVATVHPGLFGAVLVLDFWLLAYPHVASTYTRVAFDRHSARRHWFLLLGLPPLVVLGTAGTAAVGGAVLLNTVYFYWQTFHYTRQSDGIARAYRRARGETSPGRDLLDDAVVYGFPIVGVLHRCAQRPAAFYGAPFHVPPVSGAMVLVVGAMVAAAFVLWCVKRALALRAGAPVLGGMLHVLSHVVVTLVAFVLVEEVTRGWLFINIWHNAQYLGFVWAMNARRFAGGVEPDRRFVSWLSQKENVLFYAVVCLFGGGAFYLLLGQATDALPRTVLPLVLVAHLSVNFHHYLVDAVIWRRPTRRT